MIMYSFYCRKKRFNSCNGYDEFHAERYQKAIRAKSIFTGSDIRPEKTRFTNTSFWQSDPFPGQRIRQPDLSAEYFRQIHDRRSSIPGNLFLPTDFELPSCRGRSSHDFAEKRKPAKEQNRSGRHSTVELGTKTLHRYPSIISRCTRQQGTGQHITL